MTSTIPADESQGEASPPKGPKDSPLSLPEVQGVSRVRQARSRKFEAWAGGADALLHVYDKAVDALRRAFNDTELELRKLPEYEQRRMVAGFVVSATVGGHGNLERSGDLRSVLGSMDVREVESITIRNPPAYGEQRPAIAVTFTASGTTLTVEGSDPLWVTATYEELSAILRRDVPKWSWVYGLWGPMLLILALYWLLLWAEILLFRPQALSWSYLVFMVVAMGASIAVANWWFNGLRDRLFPRFELLVIGARSSGYRVGAWLFGGLGAMASVLGIWQFFVH